jgi:hypothetical protein
MLDLKESFLLISIFFISVYIFNRLYLKNKYKKIENKRLNLNFMGCILIIFGLLKLYDIHMFSQIFQKYDIISKNIPAYSYAYPFIEILLGISYLKKIYISEVKVMTIFLMIVSITSVIISMLVGAKLRCGCMGTFFHIPLSYVTLSENIVMLYMATRK